MNFLHIKTNSLVDLAGRNKKDLIDWDNLGTNSKLINLNDLTISQTNENGLCCYILPIADEAKAVAFIEGECKTYNVVAEILTEEKALVHHEELKVYRESLKATE